MYTLKQIQEKISGISISGIDDPGQISIQTIKTVEDAVPGSITILTNKKYAQAADSSSASAILTTEKLSEGLKKPLIIAQNTDMALYHLVNLLYPNDKIEPSISSTAKIADSVRIGINANIADFVVIEGNVRIGDNCNIAPGVFIGKGTVIGNNADIGPNCAIYHNVVIGDNFAAYANSTFGSDGFKVIPSREKAIQIKHIGGLVIGNDVIVASNCAIDRGVLSNTVIGDGCKFDNHVHIAHNCKIGKNVLIAANTAVAGTSNLGDNVIIGGCSAIADHVDIPANSIIAGGTGVRNSISEANVYAGAEFGLTLPEFQKLRVNIKHLVNFKSWSKRIENLEKKSGISE